MRIGMRISFPGAYKAPMEIRATDRIQRAQPDAQPLSHHSLTAAHDLNAGKNAEIILDLVNEAARQ